MYPVQTLLTKPDEQKRFLHVALIQTTSITLASSAGLDMKEIEVIDESIVESASLAEGVEKRKQITVTRTR